jgi:Amt family ammonium transporter
VSPAGAIWIGAIAGILVPLGVDFLEHRRIDDPIGAVPVHMFCGIFGTLAVGLFASGSYGIPTADGADVTAPVKGLFYGGGGDQLLAQAIGSASCVIVVFAVAMVAMKLIAKAAPGEWKLRVSKDGELEGLDLHEHGTPAYHVEFGQGMTYTSLINTSVPFEKVSVPAGPPDIESIPTPAAPTSPAPSAFSSGDASPPSDGAPTSPPWS